MTVTPSPIVDPAASTSVNDLWELAYALRPNWRDGIRLARAWSTEVRRARSGAERRVQRLSRPTRTISYSTTGLRSLEVGRIQAWANRLTSARNMVPIWSDAAPIAEITGGDTMVCTRALHYHEFEAGARVLIVRYPQHQSDPTFVGIGVVQSVSEASGTVALAPTVPPGIQAGDVLVPIMEALPVLASEMDLVTSRIGEARISFDEVVGPEAYSARVAPGTTAAFPGVTAPEYDGLPVFWMLPHSAGDTRIGVERDGEFRNVGLGQFVTLTAALPRFRARFSMLGLDGVRARFARAFFDSRAGRTYPFWLPSPASDLRVVSIPSVSRIDVESGIESFDLESFRGAVYLQVRDGASEAFVVRKIASVTRVSGVDQITLEDDLAGVPALGTIVKAGFAYKVRFDTDEISEDWTTATIAQTAFEVVEVLEEKSVDAGVESPVQGGTLGDHQYCAPVIIPTNSGKCKSGCDKFGYAIHWADEAPILEVTKTVWHAQDEGFGSWSLQLGDDPGLTDCVLSAASYTGTYAAEAVDEPWSGTITFKKISDDAPTDCSSEFLQFPDEIVWTCPGYEGLPSWPHSRDSSLIRSFSGFFTTNYPLSGDTSSIPEGWPFEYLDTTGIWPEEYIFVVDNAVARDSGADAIAYQTRVYDPWVGNWVPVEEARITGVGAWWCNQVCYCCDPKPSSGTYDAVIVVSPGACMVGPSGGCIIYGACFNANGICGTVLDWDEGDDFTVCYSVLVDADGNIFTLCGCEIRVLDYYNPTWWGAGSQFPSVLFPSVTECCYTLSIEGPVPPVPCQRGMSFGCQPT